ncbi:hypothetical protein niasHT_014320 [Heterodera trifolii]|uniref:Uncharacterized protein n=1 Tax=Heterodera trifolii TaxID=157864 RepID=A0ABD2L887_9BILA
MNIVANFLGTLCSIVIFIVHFPNCAQAVTTKVTFGNGRPSTVHVWHNGQWKFSFETKKDRNGILYENINTRQWTGLDDNDPIDFKYENGTWIKRLKVSELRAKKKQYFPKNSQSYEITVFLNGQPMFEGSAIYERSQLKNYLEIDPEKWDQRQSDDVITFQRSDDGQLLGSATVSILREVGDIDFSREVKNFGSLSGGV